MGLAAGGDGGALSIGPERRDRSHGDLSFIHISVPHFPVQKGIRYVPVTVDAELQELPYDMASRVAYDVMHEVFAVHNEFGRFMDENIYRDEEKASPGSPERVRRGQTRDSGLKRAGRLLCRGWATATLRELSARFGLTHPDRASDLIGRGKRSAKSNRDVARQVASVEQALG
jgi:hypothetical protein